MPVDCNNLPKLDAFLDILAQPAGWKMADGAFTGQFANGTLFPFGWASEQMVAPEDDAVGIKSGVYFVQDLEAQTFQWGLISFAGFMLMALAIIMQRVAAGEQLKSILCGAGASTDDALAEWSFKNGDLENESALYEALQETEEYQ